MKDGVFGRQTKNKTTAHLPLASCAACRPRRTPASASAPARLTVADKFCNGWRGDTPFGHSAARGPRSGQFVPVTKIKSCIRMPCVPHGPSQACRCARWADTQYHTGHGECKLSHRKLRKGETYLHRYSLTFASACHNQWRIDWFPTRLTLFGSGRNPRPPFPVCSPAARPFVAPT